MLNLSDLTEQSVAKLNITMLFGGRSTVQDQHLKLAPQSHILFYSLL